MIEPLDRILNAVDTLRSESMDPVRLDAWQEAKAALHEARERYAALVAVAHRARDLVDILDRYEAALEDGDKDVIALLAETGSEAEDRLVDALNGAVPDLGADIDLQDESELSGEAAQLAALNRFADEEEKQAPNDEPPDTVADGGAIQRLPKGL